MTAQILVSAILFVLGAVSLAVALRSERRMQRHRRPGVTYAQVTLRRDGAWRRDDLFDETGLRHQREAARYGLVGVLLWVAALGAWVLLA